MSFYNVTGTVPSSRDTVMGRNKWSKSGGHYINKIYNKFAKFVVRAIKNFYCIRNYESMSWGLGGG